MMFMEEVAIKSKEETSLFYSKLPEMLDLADKDLSRTGTRQHIPHGEGVLVSFIFALPAGGSAATRGG